jgi:DNA-binding CsgD family transcriptional regulator
MNLATCTAFTSCLRAAGSDAFTGVLTDALNEFVDVDDCMVLETGTCDGLKGRFSAPYESGNVPPALDDACGGRHPTHLHQTAGSVSVRKALDRLLVTVSCSDRMSVLAVYRRAGGSPFSDTDISSVSSIADVLAELADVHLRLSSRRTASREVEHTWKAVLSERERAVARLLARGETARTIADLLGVAQTSVVTYKKRAFVKLGVSRQCELAALVGSLQ